jgi:hypothetical protein
MDPKSKRIRSTLYPQIDFRLDVSVPGSKKLNREDALELFNLSLDDIPEYDFSGISSVEFMPSYYRKDGMRIEGSYLPKELASENFEDLIYLYDTEDQSIPKKIMNLRTNPIYEKGIPVRVYETLESEWISDAPRLYFGNDVDSRDKIYKHLAHELGHHILSESGDDVLSESMAEQYATNLAGGINKHNPKGKRFEDINDILAYSERLQELRNPSTKKMMEYSMVKDEV